VSTCAASACTRSANTVASVPILRSESTYEYPSSSVSPKARGVAIVWYARVAERADEDGVERAQRVVAAGRNGRARFQVVIRAPRELLEIKTADRLEHASRLGNDLYPDAVTRDDRNALPQRAPGLPEPLIIKKDLCIISAEP
jgi:hypothetical protein